MLRIVFFLFIKNLQKHRRVKRWLDKISSKARLKFQQLLLSPKILINFQMVLQKLKPKN